VVRHFQHVTPRGEYVVVLGEGPSPS
jgi:hypothetical protein